MLILLVQATGPFCILMLHIYAAMKFSTSVYYCFTWLLCFDFPFVSFFQLHQKSAGFLSSKTRKTKPSAVTDATMNSTMHCKSVQIKVGVCIMLS
jgi:hypothetical protein